MYRYTKKSFTVTDTATDTATPNRPQIVQNFGFHDILLPAIFWYNNPSPCATLHDVIGGEEIYLRPAPEVPSLELLEL